MHRPMPFSPIKLALSRKFSLDANVATSLEEEHRQIEGVLAQLEALADALPKLPPASALEGMILYLREAIPAHCRHEERALAATLARAVDADRPRNRALELLRDEHGANEAIAHELADALEECVLDGAATAPEALGQLARQFFVLMRRHMAWEEFVVDVLLPPPTGEKGEPA